MILFQTYGRLPVGIYTTLSVPVIIGILNDIFTFALSSHLNSLLFLKFIPSLLSSLFRQMRVGFCAHGASSIVVWVFQLLWFSLVFDRRN